MMESDNDDDHFYRLSFPYYICIVYQMYQMYTRRFSFKRRANQALQQKHKCVNTAG